MLKKRSRKIKRDKNNQTKTNKVAKIIKKVQVPKLITNTKNHRLKIQSRVWNFRYTMLYKRRERKREKKVTKIIKNKNRYKIDNQHQKGKIKNLEQSLEFQKYSVK